MGPTSKGREVRGGEGKKRQERGREGKKGLRGEGGTWTPW